MSFLASKSVVHGDLASRNVLVFDNYVLKLSDFGMSRNLYKSTMYVQRNNTRPLPWRWLSPEVLEDRQFSVKSDVWSYGVTLWEIFELAKIPYPNLDWDLKFIQDLKDGTLRLLKPELMPQEVYDDLVLLCFDKNPRARKDFTQICKYWAEYLTPAKKNVALEELYKKLGSHPKQGLTDEQVNWNIERFGGNSMTPLQQDSMCLSFTESLVGGFQVFLWTGSILSFASYVVQCTQMESPLEYNLYLGSILAILAGALGCFNFSKEYEISPNRNLFKFSLKMDRNLAKCIRNSELQILGASELAVGDIVKLQVGEIIPADIRLIEALNFNVDNSLVTGVSDPQLLNPECTNDNPFETNNSAFASTLVLEGCAKGIVVNVGDKCYVSRIARSATKLNSPDKPLAKIILRFVILISVVAVCFGVAFLITLLIAGFNIVDSCLFSTGITVAIIPVGLSVSFPVILALTAKRLNKKGCLVKRLYDVETLGATTVICFDKTGTLTRNQMTVNHLWFGNNMHEVASGVQFDKGDAGFGALARAASLCSRATFLADQQHLPIQERIVHGDASEAAILRFIEETVGGVAQYRAGMPKVFETPFDSTKKLQLSIHEALVEGRKKNLLVMKGAPEIIIEYCSQIVVGHKEYDMNSDLCRDMFNSTCEKLGGMGERMLGFCDLVLPEEDYPIGFEFTEENTEYLKLGLRFVGLVSMIDPVRPGARETVEACRSAGIKVVMITGDHASTSTAVAKKVGIISPDKETLEELAKRVDIDAVEADDPDIETIVVTGEDLNKFSSEQLDNVLRNHSEVVFARLSPEQKLLIIQSFQRLNEVVAVVGDGVNDCPAMKKADVGIAIGISGSEITKHTADMIFLNDGLTSIVAGIKEGRAAFEKLVKCIRYPLAANMTLLVPFFLFILLGIPLPLDLIPILIICLGTGVAPIMSILYEKPERSLMKKLPRGYFKNHLISGRFIAYSYSQLGVVESAAGVLSYFMEMNEGGFSLNRLIGIATAWNDPDSQVTNWRGYQWSHHSRKWLERKCWTYYFHAVLILQLVTLLVSMTRMVKLVEKFCNNWFISAGILIQAVIAAILTYTLSHATKLHKVSWMFFIWWLVAIHIVSLLFLTTKSKVLGSKVQRK